MSRKCEATNKDGTPCGTFAVNGTNPARCIYHCDPANLKAQVYTPQYELRKRIKILNRRLNMLHKIQNEATKARITIDLINKIGELEDKLEAMEAPPAPADTPPAGTTAEKLASWEKSLT